MIAVVGPTASGKTALAVALAKRYDGEVLSFDSMQLYKGMDVATAKPTADEMEGVPHHLIDAVDQAEPYSVARFQKDAARIVEDIQSRGKTVIMAGGTGQYLDAFLQNIQFLDAGNPGEVREKLRAELEEKGIDPLYERLQEIDSEYAAGLHKNNTGRVLRALEVYELTGYTMSYQIERSRENPGDYNVCFLGLNARDRDVLYHRINTRVDRMVENGLLDETREYLKNPPGNTASQAIGIKEMVPYLEGTATLEECREKLKADTRHYAKRQLTWFRRNEAVHWLYIDEYETWGELVKQAFAITDAFLEGSETE